MGSKKKADGTKTTEAQGVLNEMPAMDAVGQAATEYIKSLGALKRQKEATDQAGCTLAAALREAKRREIKIEGMLVKLTHVDKDVIKISKPKDK